MDEISVSDSYTEYLIEDSYYTEYQITEDVERGVGSGRPGFGFGLPRLAPDLAF